MIYQGDAMAYIESTPEILRTILEDRVQILRESMEMLWEEAVSEIYLTGSGSSYHAAAAAAPFLKKALGIRVFPVYPAAFLQEEALWADKSLVLGISQQGTSISVIHALDRAKKRGLWTISVTGEYDTEITKHADANIYVECGLEDAGATTKGYTATVFTLMLFGLGLAENQGRLSSEESLCCRERMAAVIRNMGAVLETGRDFSEQTAKILKDSEDLILISGETLKSSLLEGVLKFSESCRFPVRGYEADEFMHGMYNAVTDHTDFLYLFPEEQETRIRMEKLFVYYGKRGHRQFAVNRQDPEDPCTFLKDPDFSFLEQILPLQMLFVLTSRERGIDLNIPKDPDFHKNMGSKIEE